MSPPKFTDYIPCIHCMSLCSLVGACWVLWGMFVYTLLIFRVYTILVFASAAAIEGVESSWQNKFLLARTQLCCEQRHVIAAPSSWQNKILFTRTHVCGEQWRLLAVPRPGHRACWPNKIEVSSCTQCHERTRRAKSE